MLTRYTGIGTYSRKFTDVFSFTSNQAALAEIKSFASGVYTERRFMLKELDQYAGSMAIPFAQGGAGLSIMHRGDGQYRESQLGLAYGRGLGPNMALGVQFNYHLVGISGYGSAAAVHAEIGAVFHLTDQLHSGIHVYNLLNSRLRNEAGAKLPAVYSLGLGYEISDRLLMSAELGKTEDQPVNVNLGVHYAFVEQLFIRSGIATSSSQFFLGAGIKWRDIRLDVAGSYHLHLGVTPSLSLVFGRQKDTP